MKVLKKIFFGILLFLVAIPAISQDSSKVFASSVHYPWGGGKALIGSVSFPYSYNANTDSEGNIYLTKYTSDSKARVHKMDKYGNNLWGDNGVDVSVNNATNTSRDMPEGVSDGDGGVYVTYWDTNGGPPEIMLQRVSKDGVAVFASGGIKVSNSYMQQYGELAKGNNGSAIISFVNTDEATSMCRPAVQKVSSNGDVLWGNEGLSLDELDSNYCSSYPEITETADGVIVAWINSNTDVIKAQKINFSGDIQWTSNGVTVFTPTLSGFDKDFILVSDNSTGAYISCTSNCATVNKINGDGSVPWSTNGINLGSKVGSFRTSFNLDIAPMVADSEGNLYVWGLNGSDPVVVKLDSTGAEVWDSPLTIDIFAGVNSTINGVVNSNNDLFIAWDVNMDYGVWIQKVSKDGQIIWTPNGSSMNTSDYFRTALKTGSDEITVVGTMAPYPGMPTYAMRVQSAYKVSNLPNTLDVINVKDESILVPETNGAVGNEVVKLKQKSDNKYIALVNLNTLIDLNWSSISGASDSNEGKAYAQITGAPGISGYSLLVPIKNGIDNAVIVCPNAASISEVSTSCGNKVTIINTETASINNSNVRLSISKIDGIDYWRVENLTQGGAISTRIESAGNNNNANNSNNQNNTNNAPQLIPTPTDKDGDGLMDTDEDKAGTDKNKPDSDGDGLLDGFEVKNSGQKGSSTYLDPLSKNSDGDKTPDNEEDFDSDKLTNLQEQANKTDPRDRDSDGDGLFDGIEIQYSTNANPLSPSKSDTDNDGIKDSEEDFDKDGVNNLDEQKYSSNFNKVDTDGDNLTDKEEIAGCILKPNTLQCSDKLFMPTDPTKADTDSDGLGDKEEALINPFNPTKTNIPVSTEEEFNENYINTTVILIVLIVGVPLAYLVLKNFRKKSYIEVV